MDHATLVLPKRHPQPPTRPCDDRVAVVERGGLTGFLVADGATGSGDGWRASGIVAAMFADPAWQDWTPAGALDLLGRADARIRSETAGAADTTAIVLVTDGSEVWGASAGDSQAFVFRDGVREDLTEGQVRKPRLGSGGAPRPFRTVLGGGILVAATDGLWQQTSRGAVKAALAGEAGAARMTLALAEAVLASNRGQLPDDLGIVLAVSR